MRAAQVTRLDGPDSVEVADLPDLAPSEDRVVIEVKAAGVTFPDVLQTRGLYQMKPELPYTPGSEVAGVVVSAPDGSRFSAGQRVAAFPGIGGLATQVATEPARVFPLPDSVSFEQGAAMPMNYLTCHFGLEVRGRVHTGESVLVHGAAGGVGTAAVQIAKALGARVIAVASSEEKRRIALDAGADEAIDVAGFKDAARDLTGGRGVDVVVDPVGGDRFTDSLRSMAPLGRLLVIGFTAGSIPEVRVNRLLLGNLDVVGVGWGAYWSGRPAYLSEQWDRLTAWMESGHLDPVLGATFPLDQVADAIRELDERRATGKVLVLPQ